MEHSKWCICNYHYGSCLPLWISRTTLINLIYVFFTCFVLGLNRTISVIDLSPYTVTFQFERAAYKDSTYNHTYYRIHFLEDDGISSPRNLTNSLIPPYDIPKVWVSLFKVASSLFTDVVKRACSSLDWAVDSQWEFD